VDLLGANVGFRHWHPMPVSQHGNRLAGQSEMGGVWEWTSTTLDKHEGFEAMPLYPGYTGKGVAISTAKSDSDVSPQPTFSMVSTTSCSVDLGQRTRALQDVRACKWIAVLMSDVFANDLQCQLVPEELPLRLGGCPHGEGCISGTLPPLGSISAL
jgi:hypothetical protein